MTGITLSDLRGKAKEQALAQLAASQRRPKARKSGKTGDGKSELEEALAGQLRTLRLKPEREWLFAPPRKWRWDFAFLDAMLAIEVEGGRWSGGEHVRGHGLERDCAKGNAGVMMGWRLLRFTDTMIESGEAIAMIQTMLAKGKD